MRRALLRGGVNFLHAGIAGIFEFGVVVAVEFDEGDGPFEMVEFGRVGDPVEINSLEAYVRDIGGHSII